MLSVKHGPQTHTTTTTTTDATITIEPDIEIIELEVLTDEGALRKAESAGIWRNMTGTATFLMAAVILPRVASDTPLVGALSEASALRSSLIGLGVIAALLTIRSYRGVKRRQASIDAAFAGGTSIRPLERLPAEESSNEQGAAAEAIGSGNRFPSSPAADIRWDGPRLMPQVATTSGPPDPPGVITGVTDPKELSGRCSFWVLPVVLVLIAICLAVIAYWTSANDFEAVFTLVRSYAQLVIFGFVGFVFFAPKSMFNAIVDPLPVHFRTEWMKDTVAFNRYKSLAYFVCIAVLISLGSMNGFLDSSDIALWGIFGCLVLLCSSATNFSLMQRAILNWRYCTWQLLFYLEISFIKEFFGAVLFFKYSWSFYPLS